MSASHTMPVTVAAEQGLIGLAAYLAVLGAALCDAVRRLAGVCARRAPPASTGGAGRRCAVSRARALAAMFVALAGAHDGLRGVPRGPVHVGDPRGRRCRSRPSRSSAHAQAGQPPGARDRRRPPSAALMRDYLRRLASTGAAYTASSVISKLFAVALLPIYTRHLTRADYGAAEVLLATVVALSIFFRLGIIEALLRFYYRTGRGRSAVAATGMRSCGPRSPSC